MLLTAKQPNAGKVMGLVLMLASLLAGMAGLAQPAQPPSPLPVRPAPAPSNGGFTVNSHPVFSAPFAPDPFDSLVASAASFDIDSPVEAHAEFDPPTAPVGGRVVYRVVVTALDESLTMPDQLPVPAGLDLHPGGRGQTYQPTGGMKLRPLTTIIYRATVTNTGTFTIPAFDLTAYGKTIKVPEASLSVVPSGAAVDHEPPRLLLDLPPGDCYVGQLLRIPVILPSPPGGGIMFLSHTHITGDFIFSEQFYMGMRVENVQHDGKSFPASVEDVLITPLREGPQELLAQGNAQNSILVDSDPVTLDVKPLPTKGVLPGFTGAVGSFQAEPPTATPAEVRAGEPLTLTVLIRGEGNLGRLIPPRVPALREWQSFPPVGETTSSAAIQQRGFASFRYTLIPLSDKIKATPEIPFSYFDPRQKAYVAMNIPAAPINVLPGAPGFQASLPPLETPPTDPEDATREKEPVFTGLMQKPGFAASSLMPSQQRWWFLALQILPAAIIGGLWAWDRRRRFLEQHPEVVLKRRARRGLRRQLQLARRAAAARDAAGFVTGAANALREACAPHLAAHPGALVFADVLQELPAPRRQGPSAEIIRRLFVAADALRFGGPVREGTDLLALQPELEQVLAELRTRL
ncbi:MAG: hypothetical protein JWQ04_3252 [Pedosphaera sp.]|nr:hypothetical protein [Pedosphaera sp.]